MKTLFKKAFLELGKITLPPFPIEYPPSFARTPIGYWLPNPNRILRDSMKSLCVLDQIVPKFTVASSLNAVFTSANVIAAAASAGSGSVHGAVTSALTHVAVTAVAIASGACLSTKVDFLWPKVEEQPGEFKLFISSLKWQR